jgi:hypothetical protein
VILPRWAKTGVSWRLGETLYLSVPFTWLVEGARKVAVAHNGPVFAGGPGLRLLHPDGCDWAETPDRVPFDVLSMHNPLATFTTRGCPRRCSFCAVPQLEGEFRELDTWKPAPLVCDNNLLESSRVHFERVVDSLRPFPLVDFNQGLDARLFTSWHADQLSRINAIVRFAFDSPRMEVPVADAISTARKAGIPKGRIRVYVLVGYKDTPESARHRLEIVRGWGMLPNPMRYQPLDASRRNQYVGPGWTQNELVDVCRYYSMTHFLGPIPFKDYSNRKPTRQAGLDWG